MVIIARFDSPNDKAIVLPPFIDECIPDMDISLTHL
jgi:hypothetical protein